MRIAGTSYVDSLVNQLNLLNARQYKLQNQAATGQRIQAPSDDPAAIARALNLLSESSLASQYASNIANLQTRATASYNVLASLKTISDRVTEITTQAANETQSPENLHAFAEEITQLAQQAVQLMNSKQGNQYLFGGTASDQPPFSITTDADGRVTSVTYGGNASVAESQIAEGTTVAVDVPGENNTGSGARGLISDSRYGADFFNHLISLQNHLVAADIDAVANVDRPALLNDEDNIIYQVATGGAVQARLQAEAAIAENRKSYLRESLFNTAGADLTHTLTQLSQTQNAYQAALATASNLLQLQQNLLNYL